MGIEELVSNAEIFSLPEQLLDQIFALCELPIGK
jgi:hypothetical protein